MDKTKALQNLLKGKATKKEIELLQQALESGEISIGGDVQRSIVIMGDGNSISLTPEALDLLKPETKTEEQVEGEPPYMGLRYFDTQDADLFYGREALTRELLARVQKESVLAIVGASGSGKSSVARAGLIPAWTKENERGVILVITPTAHPLESLAASLTRESESVTATSTLMDDLKNDSRSLRLYVKKTLGETKSLLLIDQFEETFTLCKDTDERKAFIENLLSLADEDGAARVVITLRADFYHHCAEYEGLRNALKTHQEYIGAMTADELRQAITTPAEKNGWDFQTALVDLILSDVGTEPGALPLLSHALLETWKRRQGRTLTLQGYHEAGGVKKAIAQTAESVYDKLTPAEQTIARGIFLRLTELGEGTQDTRRRVKMDELAQRTGAQDIVAKVLKTLTDARLVTTEEDSAEVAHEALIREWGTLRKWLDEDRESLRLHRHLTESAREWERSGMNESYLTHRSGRLDDALVLTENMIFVLSASEQKYLNACVDLRYREQQERERQQSERREHILLKVTYQISEMVGSILDFDEILNKSLENIHNYFQSAYLCVLLFDANLQSLKFAQTTSRYYAITNPIYNEKSFFPLEGKSIACRVARKTLATKKIVVENVGDVREDQDYLDVNESTQSELCVSMLSIKNELRGVFVLEGNQINSFTEDDIDLVKNIAQQISIAIDRTQQTEELNFKSTVAAQTSWAASIAHEMNNEMGKILNWVYLIQKAAGNDWDILESAKNIEESVSRLSSVSNSRTNRPAETVEIDTMLNTKIRQETAKKGIEVDFQPGAPGARVKLKIAQFQHILKQLVNNAARAMQGIENSKILVSTQILNNSTMVEILFQDFGPGISEDKHTSVFQRPFTTKGSGGYGLLFVRQLVEDIQGEITLLPYQKGKGATFLIKLPIANQPSKVQ